MSKLRTIIDLWHEGVKAEAFDELMKLPFEDKVTDWAKLSYTFIEKGTRELKKLGPVLIDSSHGQFWFTDDKRRVESSKHPVFVPDEFQLFFSDFIDLFVCEGRAPF